jgi:cell volume regulation protein A
LVVCGVRLDELEFPEGASVALTVRGNRLVPPKGSTTLEPGDHVYVVAQPEDLPFIQLMFGRPEEE